MKACIVWNKRMHTQTQKTKWKRKICESQTKADRLLLYTHTCIKKKKTNREHQNFEEDEGSNNECNHLLYKTACAALKSDTLFKRWCFAFSKLTKPMNQKSWPSLVTSWMYFSDWFSLMITGLIAPIFSNGIITCSINVCHWMQPIFSNDNKYLLLHYWNNCQ